MSANKDIPVFILAGGLGTRISEETHLKPKPMIEIGETPILVHLMRWYHSFGFNDFVICAGYRSWEIKQYFLTYEFRQNHLMIDHREDLRNRPVALGESVGQEKWRVRVIDTGPLTQTGGRVARAIDTVLETQKFTDFALTYGDGLCDVNLNLELAFHLSHGQVGTVLGVHPSARFGELDIDTHGKVQSFLEKPQHRQGQINGGFFFFKQEFRKYLSTETDCVLERKPLSSLAEDNQLMVHPHSGFWQPMDTLRDKNLLQSLWDEGKAPWQVKTIK
jgi:glucose-1-phosphate cytidylyltransferase